jgi:hypothetical protein
MLRDVRFLPTVRLSTMTMTMTLSTMSTMTLSTMTSSNSDDGAFDEFRRARRSGRAAVALPLLPTSSLRMSECTRENDHFDATHAARLSRSPAASLHTCGRTRGETAQPRLLAVTQPHKARLSVCGDAFGVRLESGAPREEPTPCPGGEARTPIAHRTQPSVPIQAAPSARLPPRASAGGRQFPGPKTSELGDGSHPNAPGDGPAPADAAASAGRTS